MLNLIQPDQKRKIIREYRGRFAVMTLSVFFVLEIIALALLIPSYIISIAQVQSLNMQQTAVQSQSTVTESAQSTALLQTANNQMSILATSSTPSGAAKSIQDLLANSGTAIRINGITYNTQNGLREIVIQGIAATREDLVAFSNHIQGEPNVRSVDLPISNFAQSKNIDFSMTITTS